MYDCIFGRYAYINLTLKSYAMVKDKIKPSFKIWLEYEEQHILGKGGASILKAIKTEKSISKAAENLGMSYRYVWNYLDQMNRALNRPVIKTFRGGEHGGGGATLTDLGEKILKEHKRMENYVGELLVDKEYWEAVGLKISARNLLQGLVEDVDKDKITAKIKVKIEAPTIVTAIISREAVEDLDIKPGDHVKAVIKATEVMIAKEDPTQK